MPVNSGLYVYSRLGLGACFCETRVVSEVLALVPVAEQGLDLRKSESILVRLLGVVVLVGTGIEGWLVVEGVLA